MDIKRTAFLFPGQGSQSLGLLASFTDHLPFIKSVFAQASASLGYDVWELSQQGPIEKLNRTQYTQPLLLTASVALWQLWQSQGGLLPDFLVGHSLGEYTAYQCAGSFEFEEVVQLVFQRGAYMQAAISETEGAMAVIIGLTHQKVAEVCDQVRANEVVAPSNYNAPDQTVIAGHRTAVERVMELAKQEGARLTKRLSISVPAHCDLMQPAAQHLATALEEITCRVPSIPVVSNAYSTVLPDIARIKQSLVAQLYQPVCWVDNIQYLLEQGVNCFLECGPGRVLTGLMQRIASGTVYAISLGEYQGFRKALSEY